MKDISKMFTNIDAYMYKYKPEVQEASFGQNGVNDKTHIGAMAQDLQNNPLTKETVIEDEEGNLAIDTEHLTSVLAVVLSDVCERLEKLENDVKYLINRG